MKRLRRLALIVLLYVVVLGIGGYFHFHAGKESIPNCNLCHVLHFPSLHHVESQWSPSIAYFGLALTDLSVPAIEELSTISLARAPPLS